MNQVFVCGTYFHVYLVLLKTLYERDPSREYLVILNNHTPNIERLIPRLLETGLFKDVIQVPFITLSKRRLKESSLWDRTFARKKSIVKFIDENSALPTYDDFIRNSEINLVYNQGLSSSYFLSKYKGTFMRLLEDGVRNYNSSVSKFRYIKRKYILGAVIGDGMDDELKEILVQYPERLDNRVRHKGKKLPLQEMQANLTLQQQQMIMNIFMDGQSFDVTTTNNMLIITQPLSEDRFVTESYKVKLYQDILDTYGKGYHVYIKSHPRELTDYAHTLTGDFTCLPGSFPLELFDFIKGVQFKLGVTIFSSALENINCIAEKITLGKSYVKELLPGKKLLSS